MPEPTLSWIIGLTVSGTNVAAGLGVRAYNRTTGETMPDTVGNNNMKLVAAAGGFKSVIDCKDFASEYSDEDVIELKINGAEYGSTTVTINTTKGGDNSASISTTTESTSLPAISA